MARIRLLCSLAWREGERVPSSSLTHTLSRSLWFDSNATSLSFPRDGNMDITLCAKSASDRKMEGKQPYLLFWWTIELGKHTFATYPGVVAACMCALHNETRLGCAIAPRKEETPPDFHRIFFFLFLTLWLVFGAGEHLGCCLSAACLVQNSSGGSTGSPVCTRYHGHSFHRATMTTGPVKRRPLCVCACVCVFVSVSVSVSGGTTVCPQPAPCLRSPGCRTTTTSTGGGLCLQRHRRRSPRPFRASAGLSSTAHSTGGDLGTPSAIVFLSVNVCVCVANVAFCQLIFGMLVCLSLSLSLLLPALLPCTEPNGCFPTDHSPLFALSLPHQLLQLVHPRCGPRC